MKYRIIRHEVARAPGRPWLRSETIFEAVTQDGLAVIRKKQVFEKPIPGGVDWPKGKKIVFEPMKGRR